MIKIKKDAVHQSRLVRFSALLFTALFVFAGCKTDQFVEPQQKTVSDQPHLDTIILREGDVVRIAIPDSPNLDRRGRCRNHRRPVAAESYQIIFLTNIIQRTDRYRGVFFHPGFCERCRDASRKSFV